MVSTTTKRGPVAQSATLHPFRARQSAASKPTNGLAVPRRPRRVYEAAFKIMVVQEALKLPASNRIKPTCRAYPGVEPVQIRKWIRNIEALQMAQPTAKLVQKRVLPSPPDLVACGDDGDSSDTESVMSASQQTHHELAVRAATHGASRGAAPAPLNSLNSVETSNYIISPHQHSGVRCNEQMHGSEAWSDTMRVARELLSLSYSPQ